MGSEALRHYMYIPVEVAVRELDSRLLIALTAMQAGFEVVLGQKWLLAENLRYMPPGVVLFKTLTMRDAKAMRDATRCGHLIAAIDEEMPGLIATVQKLRWVVDSAVQHCKVVFATGQDHADTLLRRYPDLGPRLRIAGNPRFDLLRPELRASYDEAVSSIRAKHGPFILVNTNFGYLNSAKATPKSIVRSFVRSGKLDLSNPDDVSYIGECGRVEQANIDAVRQLIKVLPTQFPEHSIVIRPHPSEHLGMWNDYAAGLPRVVVERAGSVVPWILASDALVHTNCTTGVEAFALGKPAITLQPQPSSILEMYLASSVNHVAHDISKAVTLLHAAVRARGGDSWYPREFYDVFDRHVAGRSGPLSAKRIVAALQDLLPAPLGRTRDVAEWQPLSGYMWDTGRKSHHSRLMPDLSVDEVGRRLRSLASHLEADVEPRARSCGRSVFHLHSCSSDLPIASSGSDSGQVLRWLRTIVNRDRAQ
jgi:surface carbohydrate biosynthesis protein